jgi:hypothetical protein
MLSDSEIKKIKQRIAKADRRLARGVDERQEARGVVRESDIKAHLLKKLREQQEAS